MSYYPLQLSSSSQSPQAFNPQVPRIPPPFHLYPQSPVTPGSRRHEPLTVIRSPSAPQSTGNRAIAYDVIPGQGAMTEEYVPVNPTLLTTSTQPRDRSRRHAPVQSGHGPAPNPGKLVDIMELHNEVLRRGLGPLDWSDAVSGPQNKPMWTSTVLINQIPWAVASGVTKKRARHAAAKRALEELRRRRPRH